MPGMRLYAKKVDSNQPEIVEALRRVGVSVWVIGEPCDLLTRFRGRWQPLEVKRENAKPRKDQARQQEFLRVHEVPVVRTVDEALKAVGAIHA